MFRQILILVVIIAVADTAKPTLNKSLFWKRFKSKKSIRAVNDSITDSPTEIVAKRFKKDVLPESTGYNLVFNRFGSLARVVTAVNLFNGIVDETIPVDDVIEELAHFPKTTLKRIERFDQQKFVDFMAQITNHIGKMSTESQKLENNLVDLKKIKEMWGEGIKLDDLPDKAKLESLNSLKALDLTQIPNLSRIDLFNPPSQDMLKNVKADLQTLVKVINNIMDTFKIEETRSLVASMKPLVNFVRIMKYFVQSECAFITMADDTSINALTTSFKELENLKKSEDGVLGTIESLSHSEWTIEQFSLPPDPDRHHLKFYNIEYDVENDWVKSVIGPTDSLKTVLKFLPLFEHFETVQKMFAEIGEQKVTLQTISNIESKFGTFESSSSKIAEVLTRFQQLSFPQSVAASYENLIPMSDGIQMLHKLVRNLRMIWKLCQDYAEDIENLDFSIFETIITANGIISRVEPFISVVKKSADIKATVDQMISGAAVLTSLKTSKKPFIDFFNSLKSFNTEKEDKVISAAEVSIQLREMKKDSQYPFGSLSEKGKEIMKVAPTIDGIRKAFNSLKNTPKSEIESLRKLKDLDKYAKPLVDAFSVISTMKTFTDKYYLTIDITMQGVDLHEYVDSFEKNNKDLYKARQNWVDYEEHVNQIFDFSDQIRQVYFKNRIFHSDDLAEYGPIVEALKGIQSFDLNEKAHLRALSMLYVDPNDQNRLSQLQNLKSVHRELASLDLQFARYDASLSAISQTLTGVMKVFDSALPSPTVVPITVPSAVASTEMVKRTEPLVNVTEPSATTQEPNFWNENWYYFVIAAAVLVIVGAGLSIGCWCKKRKANKAPSTDTSGGTTSPSGGTTTPEKKETKGSNAGPNANSTNGTPSNQGRNPTNQNAPTVNNNPRPSNNNVRRSAPSGGNAGNIQNPNAQNQQQRLIGPINNPVNNRAPAQNRPNASGVPNQERAPVVVPGVAPGAAPDVAQAADRPADAPAVDALAEVDAAAVDAQAVDAQAVDAQAADAPAVAARPANAPADNAPAARQCPRVRYVEQFMADQNEDDTMNGVATIEG